MTASSAAAAHDMRSRDRDIPGLASRPTFDICTLNVSRRSCASVTEP
jgi:hypothetical protein